MTMQANTIGSDTITTLMQRRSIRKFKPDPIDEGIVKQLEMAAQQAPSSEYLNDWSAVRITDPGLKDTLAAIAKQPYVAQVPLLYVFVSDESRNIAIIHNKGVDTSSSEFTLTASYRFAQAQNDTVLALSAMETAANALGLGCVILGSLLNDIDGLIDLLKLPKYTYPVLGLAIGKPDQSPMLKPRMPRSAQFFENAYPAGTGEMLADLKDFDQRVHEYYDLRDSDRPVDAYSDQTASKAVDQHVLQKAIGPAAARQGFRLDR
ncbi:NADPH-dependent oxidoreductase [Bifidobacterium aemilianum]|uniref:NADPH-dependent oxidoreductase n=1 Tax=Bifidobacterium aemilianum TaxID=2493120 RepID=A0A366K7V8_9BIFI|nr:nitroreductase family protein [Bifidobacterium aemilianum]RBP97332.1 NADPH-dependent oxidoreductase [Bifidobacterium aemilianum]